MKAITLHQPWASLVVIGAKRYETRPWQTRHRGPLLIHAAAGSPRYAERVMDEDIAVRLVMQKWDLDRDDMIRGAILGQVEVVTMVATDELNSFISGSEVAVGDWTSGRWAWELSNPQQFEKPVPAKGAQSLWGFHGALPQAHDA